MEAKQPKITKIELGVQNEPSKLRDTAASVNAYANLCNVVVTPEEVVLHFGIRDLNPPSDDAVEGISVARIYLGVEHAKRLNQALTNTLEKHQGIMEGLLEQIQAQLNAMEVAKESGQSEGEGKKQR